MLGCVDARRKATAEKPSALAALLEGKARVRLIKHAAERTARLYFCRKIAVSARRELQPKLVEGQAAPRGGVFGLR